MVVLVKSYETWLREQPIYPLGRPEPYSVLGAADPEPACPNRLPVVVRDSGLVLFGPGLAEDVVEPGCGRVESCRVCRYKRRRWQAAKLGYGFGTGPAVRWSGTGCIRDYAEAAGVRVGARTLTLTTPGLAPVRLPGLRKPPGVERTRLKSDTAPSAARHSNRAFLESLRAFRRSYLHKAGQELADGHKVWWVRVVEPHRYGEPARRFVWWDKLHREDVKVDIGRLHCHWVLLSTDHDWLERWFPEIEGPSRGNYGARSLQQWWKTLGPEQRRYVHRLVSLGFGPVCDVGASVDKHLEDGGVPGKPPPSAVSYFLSYLSDRKTDPDGTERQGGVDRQERKFRRGKGHHNLKFREPLQGGRIERGAHGMEFSQNWPERQRHVSETVSDVLGVGLKAKRRYSGTLAEPSIAVRDKAGTMAEFGRGKEHRKVKADKAAQAWIERMINDKPHELARISADILHRRRLGGRKAIKVTCEAGCCTVTKPYDTKAIGQDLQLRLHRHGWPFTLTRASRELLPAKLVETNGWHGGHECYTALHDR